MTNTDENHCSLSFTQDLSEENLISNAAIGKGICNKLSQSKSMSPRTARTYAVKNGYTLEKVGKYIYQDSVVSMGDNVR